MPRLKYPLGWLARRVLFPLLLCSILSYWWLSGFWERRGNKNIQYLGNISTVDHNERYKEVNCSLFNSY